MLALAGLEVVTVRFVTGEDGRATALEIRQPGAVYTAQRKRPDGG